MLLKQSVLKLADAAILPSQTQTFSHLELSSQTSKQMFIEDSYAVFNVCKHL